MKRIFQVSVTGDRIGMIFLPMRASIYFNSLFGCDMPLWNSFGEKFMFILQKKERKFAELSLHIVLIGTI